MASFANLGVFSLLGLLLCFFFFLALALFILPLSASVFPLASVHTLFLLCLTHHSLPGGQANREMSLGSGGTGNEWSQKWGARGTQELGMESSLVSAAATEQTSQL